VLTGFADIHARIGAPSRDVSAAIVHLYVGEKFR
jgi:hypothetical protein